MYSGAGSALAASGASARSAPMYSGAGSALAASGASARRAAASTPWAARTYSVAWTPSSARCVGACAARCCRAASAALCSASHASDHVSGARRGAVSAPSGYRPRCAAVRASSTCSASRAGVSARSAATASRSCVTSAYAERGGAAAAASVVAMRTGSTRVPRARCAVPLDHGRPGAGGARAAELVCGGRGVRGAHGAAEEEAPGRLCAC